MSKGGWTRLANRVNYLQEFDKTWNEYLVGFGNLTGNHFIGLRNIRNLIINQKMQLRFDLFNNKNDYYFIVYDEFFVASESENFRWNYGKKSYGDLPDNRHNNGWQFSTKDKILNAAGYNCPNGWKTGWWYRACQTNNILSPSNQWCWREDSFTSCVGGYRTFLYSKMMIRPLI
jgi:angiopoietin 2